MVGLLNDRSMHWTTFKPDLASVGKRVASFPDHRGNVREGVIFEIDEHTIRVDYAGYGVCTLKRRNGRLWNDHIDTSLDIGMIEATKQE